MTEETQKSTIQNILPIVIKLFENSNLNMDWTPAVQRRALSVFSDLVTDNETLQLSAMEGGAITKLAKILLHDVAATTLPGTVSSTTTPTDAVTTSLLIPPSSASTISSLNDAIPNSTKQNFKDSFDKNFNPTSAKIEESSEKLKEVCLSFSTFLLFYDEYGVI